MLFSCAELIHRMRSCKILSMCRNYKVPKLHSRSWTMDNICGIPFYPNLIVLCYMNIMEHFVPCSQETNEYHLRTPGYMTLAIFWCLLFQIEVPTLWVCISFSYFGLVLILFFPLPASQTQGQVHSGREETNTMVFANSLCWLLVAFLRHIKKYISSVWIFHWSKVFGVCEPISWNAALSGGRVCHSQHGCYQLTPAPQVSTLPMCQLLFCFHNFMITN